MNIFKSSIETAVNYIQNGEIIIIPTDTLYGFSFDAYDSKIIDKFNKLKKRKSPLSIIVDSIEMAKKYAKIDNINLVNSILPGPFTALFYKKESILPNLITYQSEKIGIRIPEHSFAKKIVSKLKRPITTTSVNIHGELPLKNIKNIKAAFPEIPCFEDGELNSKGSTIIDFTMNPPKIIRQGDGVLN